MEVFKISFKTHFSNAGTILVYLFLAVIFPFYMIYSYGKQDILTFISLAILFFLCFFIPQTVLHLNYYFLNKEVTFAYNPSLKKITIDNRDGSYTFSLEDISFINYYKSRPLAEERLQWFPWDGYNYSIIRLKSGRKFLITSLLVPNMHLPIDQSKVKLNKVFFPLASMEENSIENRVPEKYKEKMKGKSDEELKEIVSSYKTYNDLFIYAAKKELELRGNKV